MALLFFFFFKQKTAYEMRISDWSSDVCSSDLPGARLWSDDGSRETARQSLRMALTPDSVTSAKLFVVAPGAGPARQDFTIAVRALDDDPRGDRETIQFDRPGTEP